MRRHSNAGCYCIRHIRLQGLDFSHLVCSRDSSCAGVLLTTKGMQKIMDWWCCSHPGTVLALCGRYQGIKVIPDLYKSFKRLLPVSKSLLFSCLNPKPFISPYTAGSCTTSSLVAPFNGCMIQFAPCLESPWAKASPK